MKRNDSDRLLEQRRRILEAAARAIAEHGFYGMSMRALAKATGKSLATAYNYFSSKEEILFALQKEAFENLIGAAERALGEVEAPSSRLYLFILNHISYFTDHADVMRVLIHEAGSLPPARRRVIRKLKSDYFDVGRGVIEKLLAEGCGAVGFSGRAPDDRADSAEIERISYSLFGMLNWVYSWHEPSRHGDPRDVARTMHRLILCGALESCPLAELRSGMNRQFEQLECPPLLGGASGSTPTGARSHR